MGARRRSDGAGLSSLARPVASRQPHAPPCPLFAGARDLSRTALIAFSVLAGLAAAYWVAAAGDWPAMLGALAAVGWGGMLLLTAIRAAIVALCGVGWGLLVRPLAPQAGWGALLLLRWVREAVNVLLPVAQVGGDVVGGALLRRWRVPPAVCGAGVLVDLLVQAGAQAAFTLLGLALLLGVPGAEEAAAWTGGGLALAAAALAGFWLAQRAGLFGVAERAIRGVAQRLSGQEVAAVGVQAALDAVHRNRRALAASFGVHLVAWIAGIAEVWVVLRLMGYPAGPVECIVLESLGQAVRGLGSPIPGSVGVQEGGYVLLGALFGLPAGAMLALSLAKRVPDLVLGVPGLLAWAAIRVRSPEPAPAT